MRPRMLRVIGAEPGRERDPLRRPGRGLHARRRARRRRGRRCAEPTTASASTRRSCRACSSASTAPITPAPRAARASGSRSSSTSSARRAARSRRAAARARGSRSAACSRCAREPDPSDSFTGSSPFVHHPVAPHASRAAVTLPCGFMTVTTPQHRLRQARRARRLTPTAAAPRRCSPSPGSTVSYSGNVALRASTWTSARTSSRRSSGRRAAARARSSAASTG